MSWTKKGNEFLPNISKQELKTLYKKESIPKSKMRLLAALLRKENKSLTDIAFSLQKPIMTISDWLRRMEKEGLDRIYDIKQSGKPSKLSEKQIVELHKILNKSPQKQDLPYVIWTTKLVRYFIEIKYQISLSLWQIRRILQKLKFSLQKPRPEHYKANKKLQETFKKISNQKLDHLLKMDGRSFVLMNASSL